MLEHRLNVAVIIGSTRTGHFGPVPAQWIAAEAAKRDDSAEAMFDQLAWWGHVLCDARAR